MHPPRLALASTLFCTALLIAGCQPPAPPAGDAGPAPNEETMQQKVESMKMVDSGTNKAFKYKAPQFGQIYVFDETTGLYAYKGPLAKGETFTFEPASSRAQIDKETIDLMRNTNDRDEYRLYFVPG